MKQVATLLLKDGTVFQGRLIGAHGCCVGEAVFNTAMTGYQEILTDPSYAGQIVTLTYPHIGNTGTNDEDNESRQVYAAGLVVRDVPSHASSWRCQHALDAYLRHYGTMAIADIDTRQLTCHLRDHGAQNAVLFSSDVDMAQARRELAAFTGLQGLDLAATVSVREPYVWEQGVWGSTRPEPARHTVVAYDFGIKRNILRCLVSAGCRLTVVPAQTPINQVLAQKPDGVFFVERPRRSRALQLCDRGGSAAARCQDSDFWHLPGASAAGARVWCPHRQDEVRAPRRQPPGN